MAELDKAKNVIKRLKEHLSGPQLDDLVIKAARPVAARLEYYERQYPESPNGRPLPYAYTLDGKPSKFKSRKQRAYVMWAIRHGVIKIPYRRSGRLGQSVTSQVILTRPMVALISTGSNLSYSPYVVDRRADAGGQQNPYHTETGWQEWPDLPAQHGEELLLIFVGVLRAELLALIRPKDGP